MRGWLLLAALVWAGPLAATEPDLGPADKNPSDNGNRFVLTQVRYPGDWDPSPQTWGVIRNFLRRNTSLDPALDRSIVDAWNEDVFSAPCLLLAGGGPVPLDEAGLDILRRYLNSGGFLWIDVPKAGILGTSTEQWPSRLFPGEFWRNIPLDDALNRSFYLLPASAGRDLEGCWLNGRWAMVRTPGVLSAWVTPQEGPSARKTTVNVLLYSVTGTYKTDALHQPFIEQRLRWEKRP